MSTEPEAAAGRISAAGHRSVGGLRHGRPFGKVAQEPRRWRREVTGIGGLPGQGACPCGSGVMAKRAAHDHREAKHAPGTMHGQPLGDRAAERYPGDMRGRDVVPVEYGDGIGGHVRQRVRSRGEIHAG